MNVEKAGTGDIGALTGLRLEYLREDLGRLGEEEECILRRDLPGYFRSHLNRDLFAYVIREEGAIVSCAFLLVVEKPMSPAFISGKTGTVLNVYSCPSRRGKGYAGAIIKALLRDAREKGLSVIELKSTEAGRRLYLSAGFSEDDSGYYRMKWTNR